MKKFLPALAGVLAIACAQPTFGQSPCDIKGIATDPAVATNPEYPARMNTFNWYYGQQYNGRWWNLNSAARPNETAIWMPWEQSDNSAMTHLLGKTDLPADGWELIKRNLGYDDGGVPIANFTNPYVVLYNKRSGMLRIFVASAERKQDYQFAEIKLVFSGSAQKKAGTLNRLEGIGTALENTSPGRDSNEFSSVTRFLNDGLKWFMADFPMEYDPCTCQFDSKLRIEVRLVSKVDIQLSGVTQGTLVSADVATKASSTSTDFDKAVAMFKKTGTTIKKGQATYKTLSGYTSSINKLLTAQGTKSSTTDADDKKAAFAQLTSALGSSGFLKAGLQAVPYLGAAVSILDSFFGGGKASSGPQQVSIQPMSIEMTTQMTGMMDATALYQEITFNNPGTRAITNREEYPYYNEALGVFSLIRKPIVETQITSTRDASGGVNRVINYHVAEDLQYVINPASGLEVQDFQVAIVQEGYRYPAVLPSDWAYEGLVPASGDNVHAIRTAYELSGCLTNQVFTLDIPDINHGFNPNLRPIYLKFMLNLRPVAASTTTQNVLVVLKYPVTVRSVSAIAVDNTHPCVAVQPQMTAAAVQSFCSSAVYTNAVALRTQATAGTSSTSAAAEPLLAQVQVYPNPATSIINFRFTSLRDGRVTTYLTDIVGRRVATLLQDEPLAAGEQQRALDVSHVAAGMYLCVVETTDGRRVTKALTIAL